MSKLSKKMTLRQFDHGYWYATEIKRFAQSLGVPAAHRLRKDELEKAIRHFLAHGKVASPTKRDPVTVRHQGRRPWAPTRTARHPLHERSRRPRRFSSGKPEGWIQRSSVDPAHDIGSIAGAKLN